VGFRRVLAENLIKAAAACEEVKRIVEHEEWLGERIDDCQRKGLGHRSIVKLFH